MKGNSYRDFDGCKTNGFHVNNYLKQNAYARNDILNMCRMLIRVRMRFHGILSEVLVETKT